MTWNQINPGDFGLSSKAMQNWRHAGRFNQAFVPYDTDGVTITAGTLDVGASGAPWKDIYLATGGSLYIGGTAQEFGAAGGASVEVIEQKSHLEKAGYDYPLSNAQSINEPFLDTDTMVLTLGKDHANTETTIYLDRDVFTISAVSTTGSGTAWQVDATGTVATNTTAGQSVNGQSVKYSVTATNTSYFMRLSSVTTLFTLGERDLKVWLYPDVVTNITEANIRLYTINTSTGFAQWSIPIASITAGTLNSIIIDMGNPDTSGADYVRASLRGCSLGFTGSATPQAVNWSWNYLRGVNEIPIKLPMQAVIDNNTNQEFINIVSVTTAGDEYILDTTTTYSHTLSSSEIKLKQLDVLNGTGRIASGTSGDAALTGWDISRNFMPTNTAGDLVISSRWFDESYPVATTTNASTTVLTVETTTVAAGYLSGDVVRLYKWELIDEEYQSPYNNSIGSNFIDLTLTANAATTSSTELTLTHANTSNQNLGGDPASEWRGVRVSCDEYYQVESQDQVQDLVKVTPTIWIPKDAGIPYPSGVYSHWKLDEASGNAKDALGIQDVTDYNGVGAITDTIGKARGGNFTSGNPGVGFTALTNNSGTIYDSNDAPFMVEVWFRLTASSAGDQTIISKGDNSQGGIVGWDIWLNGSEQLVFEIANTSISSGANVYNDGNWHYAVAVLLGLGTNEMYFYVDNVLIGQSTRAAWTTSSRGLALGCANGAAGDADNITDAISGYIRDAVFWNVPYTSISEIQNYMSERYNNGNGRALGNDIGYLQRAKITDVAGNKLTTATRLTRNDATNQDPVVFQRDALIT